MNRITNLFKNKKEGILSIYFTAGYPSLNDTIEIIKFLDDCGIDLIEVGMPFSDPIADGPVIQQSSNVAIRNGMNLNVLFNQLSEIRKYTQIPIVLMGYINPVYQFGFKNFIDKMVSCDLDGLILPDMPLDEYESDLKIIFEKNNLSFISLITPNTSEERVIKIDKNSSGFIYVVSSSSTTGKRSEIDQNQISYFKRINNLNLKNKVLIGFGISDKETYLNACKYSSGAIIGTKFIESISKGNLKKNIKKFISEIRP